MSYENILSIIASVMIIIFSICWLGLAIYIVFNLKKVIKMVENVLAKQEGEQ